MRLFETFWGVAGAASVLCLTMTGPSSAAPTVPPARREIQAAYNKIDAALAQKDVDTACDYNSDDCQFYNAKGRLLETGGGRQEVVDLVQNVDILQRTAKVLSFTGTATEATVTVKCRTVSGASNRITGRVAKVVSDDVFRDYWVKTSDGWRRERSRQLQSKVALRKNF